jgi:hypothetical protein
VPALVLLLGGRQPQRLLGQLGRGGQSAAVGRQSDGAVERRGDLGVGSIP